MAPSPAAVPDHPASPAATPRAISPKSSLSPTARPFYPGESTAGRPKELRWLNGSDDELERVDYSYTPSSSASSRPSSYRDVLCRASPPPATQGHGLLPQAEVAAPTPVEGAAMGRRRSSRRARKRRRRLPLRVADAPRRAEARQAPSPVTQSWPWIDADGFQKVMSRSNRRRLRKSDAASAHSSPSSSSRCIPQELAGRCLNCLSYSHRVATCRLPRRCLRCHGFRHLARECRRPRAPHGRQPTPPDSRQRPPPPVRRPRQQSSLPGQRQQPVLEMRSAARGPEQTARRRPVCLESDIIAAIDFELKCCRVDWSHREEDPMLVEANATLPEARVTCQESPGSAIQGAEQIVLGSEELAVPAADLVTATDDCPGAVDRVAISEVDQGVVDAVDAPVPPVEVLADCSSVPPLVKVVGSASAEATTTVAAPEVNHSTALEAFINKVTKPIPAPLVDKPPRRRRVDPVLIDAPPQLPSSEASGIRRSYRQALDPLSAVKPTRRGEVVLMRQLGEVGVPLPLAASAEQAVKQFFLEGPPPHHFDALADMFPTLRNKSKTSPYVGLSAD
ncbi:unnamed protein product [Urochloa humidicola]